MSAARSFGMSGKSYYTNVTKPIDINLNFIVDSTNGNGLGVRSVKSNGVVESVFMHTSATPGVVGSNTNPNPPVGYALVRFKNNFNVYLGGFNGSVAPLASTNLTSVTTHSPYVITSLGTTTLAQWQAAGLPQGFTPTVGQFFIATETASIGGSGTVGAPGANAFLTSLVGDPNTMIANSNIAQNAGAMILVQFLAPTNSSTTTLVPTAPADGSIVSLMSRYDGSSMTIDGL